MQSHFPSKQVAATTLTGTTGNDVLNAPGTVSTLVQGLQGNDTITLSLANDEAQAGKGNDSISLTRSGSVANTVFGGEGNDTVFLRSAGQFLGYVDLGAGNDSIRIGTAVTDIITDGNIFGGEGADTLAITNVVVNSTIGAGSGADLLVFSGGAAGAVTSSLVFGGKGQDTIRFNGGAPGTLTSIGGGRGNDYLAFSQGGSNLGTTNVGGGKGADSIVMGAGAVASVSGGGLNDTIRLNGGFGGGRVYGDGVGVSSAGTGTEGAADGNDFIVVGAPLGGATSVYGAGGNDTINFQTGIVNAALVNGGDGADSINLAGSAVALAFGDAVLGQPSVNGGDGNDTINIGSALYGTTSVGNVGTINGGSGSDLIIIGASAGNLTAGAYSAANITGLTAVGFVLAGASGDTVRIGNQTAVTGATGANWNVANASIFVASSLSTLSQGMLANFATTAQGGSIGVFSDGTDTVISITANGAATSVYTVLVDGSDLVLTSISGANVTLVSSNFAFTVASGGTGGVDITFS